MQLLTMSSFSANGEAPPTPAIPKKKMSMSFEQYKKLSNILVLHLRSFEDRTEDEGLFLNFNL